MTEEKALSVVNRTDIAKRERPVLEFSDEQRKIIRDSYANGATDQEFAVLMEIAKAKRLNPILGQIYFVKRWDNAKNGFVWASQTGIDGFRSIAEDTGLYDGQDEPEFSYDDKGHIVSCKVKVYRKDVTRPFIATAHFSEYAQTKKDGQLNHMWATKPHIMIQKCCEGLALRKAFPQELGKVYIQEEFDRDESDHARQMSAQPAAVALPEKPRMTVEDALRKVDAIQTLEQYAIVGAELDPLFAKKTTDRQVVVAALTVKKKSLSASAVKSEKAKSDTTEVVCVACDLKGKHAPECPEDPANKGREPGSDDA
jgi:phage recombination protein Bet